MKKQPFAPFPTLTSERLILRQLKDQDAPVMFLLRTDDRVNQFVNRPKPANIEQVKAFIQKIIGNKWMYWAICLHGQEALVGTICLWNFSDDQKSAEVGYELHPDFQGQGIMDEALKCVMAFCFGKADLEVVKAFTHVRNAASRRLLEKNHFQLFEAPPDQENPECIGYQLFPNY